MGTASDRYAAWRDQIYTVKRYAGQVTRRTKSVGCKTFMEEVLPVESVDEYFRHFRCLKRSERVDLGICDNGSVLNRMDV